jgi:hypothetical protein
LQGYFDFNTRIQRLSVVPGKKIITCEYESAQSMGWFEYFSNTKQTPYNDPPPDPLQGRIISLFRRFGETVASVLFVSKITHILR